MSFLSFGTKDLPDIESVRRYLYRPVCKTSCAGLASVVLSAPPGTARELDVPEYYVPPILSCPDIERAIYTLFYHLPEGFCEKFHAFLSDQSNLSDMSGFLPTASELFAIIKDIKNGGR